MSYKVVSFERKSGILFCLVGPTGSGKTSIAADLLSSVSGIKRSISATTRAPRPNERHDESYFFLSQAEFLEKRSRGEFFETEQVHGFWYGTPRQYIEEALTQCEDMLMAIDVRGALNVKRLMPDRTVVMFILPPQKEELIRRLNSRSTLAPEELQRRMQTAELEMELLMRPEHRNLIDYAFPNHSFAETLRTVQGIVNTERVRLARVILVNSSGAGV